MLCFYFESDVAKLPGLFVDPGEELASGTRTIGAERPAAMGIKLYYTTVTASRTVSRVVAF